MSRKSDQEKNKTTSSTTFYQEHSKSRTVLASIPRACSSIYSSVSYDVADFNGNSTMEIIDIECVYSITNHVFTFFWDWICSSCREFLISTEFHRFVETKFFYWEKKRSTHSIISNGLTLHQDTVARGHLIFYMLDISIDKFRIACHLTAITCATICTKPKHFFKRPLAYFGWHLEQ